MLGIVSSEMEFQIGGSNFARTDQEMRKKGRVHPTVVTDYDRSSDLIELNRINHVSRRRSSSRSLYQWKKVSKEVHAVSKWKHYTSSMRERNLGNLTNWKGPGPNYSSSKSFGRQNSACVLDSDVEDVGVEHLALYDTGGYMKPLPAVRNGEQIHPAISSSRTLIIYFAELARASLEVPQELDFEFIEGLLEEGADLNFTDRHGQTIMHEVARIWHVDVAKFILENGGDVNIADDYGRTPLHVAAAVDYPEMVEFLVSNKADLNVCTKSEHQTPTHYAAKNDAARALKVLLKLGGRMEELDYKERTPLQVAAELDRSETAKYLIDQMALAGVQDVSGCSVMSLMISKMPPVAKEALDQFHTTDRANRRQYFYLNHLEPYHLPDRHGKTISCARSPLHCVVLFNQMELIMHPVFQRLIEMKWNQFGRRGTYKNVFIHVLFALVWSVLGVTLHFVSQTNDFYKPPSTYWWRIVLEVVACTMTLYFVFLEFLEIRASKKEHQKWQNWRIFELERDLKFCHPRWPEERKYIEAEIVDIRNSGISYFNDSWNYFDWVTYGWIVAVVVTRVFAVLLKNDTARSLHPRVFALALIFIWLRLMKVFRPFGNLGPFIVMIGHIIDDTLKFGFLYFMVYVPYVCAFWIVFGGPKNAEIMERMGQDSKGWRNINDLMYSVWQLTVVGNYPWDSLLVVDRIMAQILCGTYLAVSAIVMLNLFIALMSDTFQRVYDNAKANAAMQRASAILSMEENMGEKRRESHRRLVHEKLAPEELYYDDDSTQPGSGILERMTNQIKEVVDEVLEVLTTKNGGGTGSRKNDIDSLRSELMEVSFQHEQTVKKMSKEVTEMKALLVRVLQNGTHPLLPSVRSLQPLLVEEIAKKETRTPSKRYFSGRSQRSKHQRVHSLPKSDNDDDHVPYHGLPLPQNTAGSNELPSVTVLASRGSSHHQARNGTDN